jgi:PleD family two-component response regulator
VDAVTGGLTELYNQWYFKQRLGEEFTVILMDTTPDGAMYLAKRQGRDRLLPFGPGAHEQTTGAPATK